MKNSKKIYLLQFIALCLIFASCKKKDEIETGITEIDNTYKFSQKLIDTHSTDSGYNYFELYLNKTMNDSIYSIGIQDKGSYKLRAHGWGYRKNRIGDWHYEKVYDDKKVVTDSIVNYVIECEGDLKNTVQYFKNNVLDRTKGYFYEVNMKKDVSVGDTLIIDLNYVYDTVTYQKISHELYLLKLPDFYDHCSATHFVVDSLPIIKNKSTMRLLMTEKGKNRFLGYYYIVPKEQKDNESTTARQIFTEIKFEVK